MHRDVNRRPSRRALAFLPWLGLAGFLGLTGSVPSAESPATRSGASDSPVASQPLPDPLVAPPRPAAEGPGSDPTLDRARATDTPSEAQARLALRALAPGVFLLGGKVRLDATRREVSFPAVVNRRDGPMEYLLVHTSGKTHESVLRTDVQPSQIQMALLLLGAKGAVATNTLGGESGPMDGGGPEPVSEPSSENLPGDKVSLRVRWDAEGRQITRAASEFIRNGAASSDSKPGRGNWVYNGSIVAGGRFLADLDGSVISLVTDPVALINNEAPGHDNDEIWGVDTNGLPAAGVPLEVVIGLEKVAKKEAPSSGEKSVTRSE